MSNFIAQAQVSVVLVGIGAAFIGRSVIPLVTCVVIAAAIGQAFGRAGGRRRR